MSTTIHKYRLRPEPQAEGEAIAYSFEAPRLGTPVHFERIAPDDPGVESECYVWLRIVEGQGGWSKRTIEVYGTGWSIPDDKVRKHITTFRDGPFVWHVFEVADEEPF